MGADAVTVVGVQGVRLRERPHKVLEVTLLSGAPLQEVLHGPRPRAFSMWRQSSGVPAGEQTLWALPATAAAVRWARKRVFAQPQIMQRMLERQCGGFNGIQAAVRQTLGVTLANWQQFRALPSGELQRLLEARAGDGGARGWHQVLCDGGPFCDRVTLEHATTSLLHPAHAGPPGVREFFAVGAAGTVDLVFADFSRRLLLRPDTAGWHAATVRSPQRSKEQLETADESRIDLQHFAGDTPLLAWVGRQLRAADRAGWRPGVMVNLDQGMKTAEDGHPCLSSAVGICDLRFPLLHGAPVDRPLGRYPVPPVRAANGHLSVRSALHHDDDSLRARAQQLGIADTLPEADLLEQIAVRACEQVPVTRLCGPQAAAFVRKLSGDMYGGGNLDALESLTCHAMSRMFVHTGTPGRPHRLTGTVIGLETFLPLNPFTA